MRRAKVCTPSVQRLSIRGERRRSSTMASMVADGVEMRRAFEGAVPHPGFEYSLAASHDPWFFGCSREGHPALLRRLSVAPRDGSRLFGAIRVRSMRDVDVEIGGSEERTNIVALECLDERLVDTFVVVALDVVQGVGNGAAVARDLIDRLSRWRELLTTHDPLSESSQLGLWGELELLRRFPSLPRAVEGWFGPNREAIDFSQNGIGLEVKTSTSRRVHLLRWSQAVFGGVTFAAYLVSIHAVCDPAGLSLPDQVAMARSRLPNPYNFEAKLLAAGYRHDHADAFETRWALADEPGFFRMSDVPRFTEIPDGVLDVHWRVDLSGKMPLEPSAAEALLRTFAGEQ